MTTERSRTEELASNVAILAQELRPLTDSIENCYQLLQWIVQNRGELFELLKERDSNVVGMCNGVAESLCCYTCDAGQGMSLAEALQEGWIELQRSDGPSANYHGQCPTCQAEELAEEEADYRRMEAAQGDEKKTPGSSGSLFSFEE
jgi:hypothetical protein